MPVLKVNAEDLMMINDNPEEFVNCSIDICESR